MLALTRKRNECVVINGNIKIVVVEIRGDKVRLGIEAPSDVPVFRDEVWAKIQADSALRRSENDDAKPTERAPLEPRTSPSPRRPARTAPDFAENAEFAAQTLGRRDVRSDVAELSGAPTRRDDAVAEIFYAADR